jgi:hypothetical protein
MLSPFKTPADVDAAEAFDPERDLLIALKHNLTLMGGRVLAMHDPIPDDHGCTPDQVKLLIRVRHFGVIQGAKTPKAPTPAPARRGRPKGSLNKKTAMKPARKKQS